MEVCAYGFSKATNSGEGGLFIIQAYAENFSWFCFEDAREHGYQLNAIYVFKSQIQSSGCLHIIHIASIFSRNQVVCFVFFFFKCSVSNNHGKIYSKNLDTVL